jgi:uncharacterized protein DUF6152
MTSINRRWFLALAAGLMPASAIAHHGWGGYDTSKSFTVTGKILKSTFENPHCEIEMEVDGKHWHFILAPPSRMQARGATADLIAPGKTCTVFGRGADRIYRARRQTHRVAVGREWNINRPHRYS